MSEIRHDWLADRWVIFAPERGRRPDEYDRHSSATPLRKVLCPFCLANSDQTPVPVLILPSGGSSAPRVRVIPNKFPAVAGVDTFGSILRTSRFEDSHDEGFKNSTSRGISTNTNTTTSVAPILTESTSNLFHKRDLVGAHEIVVESPEHLPSITQITHEDMCLVLEAYRQRLLHWRAHQALQYAVIFKNVGANAGASLVHTHSQLLATSFVPPEVARLSHRMNHYFEEYEIGYWNHVILEELERGERVVAETSEFIVLCPFASTLPYLVTVLPKKQQSRFEETSNKAMEQLATLLQRTLHTIERTLLDASYNFVLHTSPFHTHWDRTFHWRLEIFPRLTAQAGFEFGSSCFINPVLPETAASELRAAW